MSNNFTNYKSAGYAYTETEGYDICWTMPGCVMCLRLIGFAFDRYDGLKKKEDRRPDQAENALEENPSLIEVNIVRDFVNHNS